MGENFDDGSGRKARRQGPSLYSGVLHVSVSTGSGEGLGMVLRFGIWIHTP